ncbi:MAG: hypothetical protein IT163_11530 [Bryobacterales bacterium]|nr:hypothetical protein [Bryobacterales bacterium]
MVSNASEIQSELERILESPWLRDSNALKLFLRYVVEETLAGRQTGLKEYALGLQVFHRPADYDPRNDAIVRVQASQLRKKLASYYENEGRDSGLQIELPRGGYVPRFTARPAATATRESALVHIPRQTETGGLPAIPPRLAEVVLADRRFSWSAFLLGALIASAVAFLAWLPARTPRLPAGESVWRGFFEPRRPVVVSLGVPLFFTGGGGVYIRDVQQNRGSEPSELLRRIESALGARLVAHEDVYTGVGEAIGVATVSRWLDRAGLDVTVANSHFLGESDLAGTNLVVISSMRFETLLTHRNLPVAFRFDPADSGALINLRPLPGEQVRYVPRGGSGVDKVHGLLTVYPGAEPGTRTLYLSGVHSWTTSGTAQYSVDPDQLADLDRRLAADPPNGPRGRKSPYFQVLLELEGKADQVRHVQYVTHRYLPLP